MGSEDSPPDLVETLAVDAGVPRHLERHLGRLTRSASALGYALDGEAARAALLREAQGRDGVLVRLALSASGALATSARPLINASGPVRLALDTVPTAPYPHKTSQRSGFDAARARHPRADDVLLVNAHGRLTESTIATVALLIDGGWWTAPLADGVLPGIGRELALESGRVHERPLTPADLDADQRIALISSARGWRDAVLLGRRATDAVVTLAGRSAR